MLKLYNTLTRQKEEFIPRDPAKVGVYVCGVTPYAYTHIGHARVAVIWDVFKRYLEYKGFEVTLIQNFTDVDDKIIAKANVEGIEAQEVAERYIEDYLETMAALGVRTADRHPRVTQEIPDIIQMIQGLIDKGNAYEAQGDVYFDVSSFPQYGKLSGRSTEELEAGARIEVSPLKRNPLDFALWKAAKPGEPAWESPWGMGRPGWHIECSVMSLKYLGEGFDIHGGGLDLVFPHHENEVAQSEAYTGSQFARFWIHNGMVQVDKEKMSKSIGNTTAVREVIKKWDPILVRFFLISTHYRSPVSFSPAELDSVGKGWQRLVLAKQGVEFIAGQIDPIHEKDENPEIAELNLLLSESTRKFETAMDDDFNTALAISVLYEMANAIGPHRNKFVHGGNDTYQTQQWKTLFEDYAQAFNTLGDILGVFPDPSEEQHETPSEFVEDLLELLLSLRSQARQEKNWALADQIRDGLKELGVELIDSPSGTTWERK